MAPFVVRCPAIGLNVQGWIADDPTESDEESFEAVICTACTRAHLVNPKTASCWERTRIKTVPVLGAAVSRLTVNFRTILNYR